MDIEYQLNMRKDKLSHLFVAWERTLVGVPPTEGLPEWGPSEEEIIQYRAVHVLGGGVEEGGYEYDVDFETEADGLLIEHLDSLRIMENYREIQNMDSGMLEL